MASLELNCWVFGESSTRIFLIEIPKTKTVGVLKNEIKKQKRAFQDIDADTLNLWHISNRNSRKPVPDDQPPMPSMARLSTVFLDAPQDRHLHIVVRPPGTATMSPSSSNESNRVADATISTSWLVEIHSKLWRRRDLFGQIFRTANLTKDDFLELQRQLHKLNPDRNSESYVAKNVLATKSTFLRSRSTALFVTNLGNGLVPRLVFDASQFPFSDAVDDDDAVADDPMDIDPDYWLNGHVNSHAAHLPNEATAIFPYTIRYVDLTVLELKMMNRRVPPLMLFRNEWGNMIDIFNEREKGMGGSAIFTGQPGIGKTCLLYSILILCIISAQSIVFQDMAGKVFIIDDTVRPPKNTQVVSEDVDDVLALVDADGASCQPNEYLFSDDKHRILLTSPPRGYKHRKWLTQIAQDPDAVFVMEPWSREESVVSSLFLQRTDITLKRFQDASRVCGDIPRRCFEAAVSPANLYDATKVIEDAIRQTTELSDAIINVHRGGTIHPAFQICPNKNRFWDSCLVEPVSDWAFSEMMYELRRRSVDAAYKFYHVIQRFSSSAFSERMFENYLHQFLHTMQTPRTFTIESLDNRSATLEIDFTSNTIHLTFGAMEYFSGHLASSVKSNTSCYLQPLSPVFPSFGSFLYQPVIFQSGFSPLIALQVTTTVKHAISVQGLEKVQYSLKPKVPELKDLRPTNARKMIILFVVPDNLGAAFVKQKIKDAAKVEHWYEKTAQYVLVLSEKEVF